MTIKANKKEIEFNFHKIGFYLIGLIIATSAIHALWSGSPFFSAEPFVLIGFIAIIILFLDRDAIGISLD